MIKKITKWIKKTIISFFMLYGYNILVPAPAIIPINIITIMMITILGIPAIITLIIIKLLIY